MKTLIAIPCMDQVPALFCKSLATLKKVGECSIAMQMGSLIYTSRNDLGAMAINNEFDYVLWLDSDQVFDPDLLERMLKKLQEEDLDILTSVYFRRVAPYSPVLFKSLSYNNPGASWDEYGDLPPGLFEAAGCGFGCVLMSVDVLMSVQAKFGTMFQPLQGLGEDLAFCWRARQCGYKIMCDPTIEVGHCGQAVITGMYWRTYRHEG